MDTGTWTQALAQSFNELWLSFVEVLPSIVLAIVVLIVGWIIAKMVGVFIAKLVTLLKVDDALAAAGFTNFLKQAGYSVSGAGFVGGLVKWFIFLIFLVASLEMVGLSQVNEFMRTVVLGYLPKVIVATLILLVATVVADITYKFILGALRTAQASTAELIAVVAKISIWVFAILVALNQLGIASEFTEILFTGIVVALALALGISFGLGGKESAAKLIHRFESSIDGK